MLRISCCNQIFVLLLTACLSIGSIAYGQQFKVLSYNIRFDDHKDLETSWRNRVKDVLSVIKDAEADFIGVQEAQYNQLTDIHQSLPRHAFIGEGRDGGKKGEYCAIVYDSIRYSPAQHGTFWLHPEDEKTPGWDAAYPRIVTWGLFQSNFTDRQVLIVNTHLDHVGTLARRESVNMLIKRLDEMNQDHVPVVIMGDFNMEWHEPPIVKMRNLYRYAQDDVQSSYSGTFNNFNHDEPPPVRIDYIFAKGDVKTIDAGTIQTKINDRYPSDHLPVYAIYRLNHFNETFGSATLNLNHDWTTIKSPNRDFDPWNNKASWTKVQLPHCWNTGDLIDDEPGYWRGTSWYNKKVNVPKPIAGERYYLFFEGANEVLTLFVNGDSVGNHIGGYTSFSFDITPYLSDQQPQDIMIRLSNELNPDIIPIEADFNFYNGIYRDVSLLKTADLHYDRGYGGSNGMYCYPSLEGEDGRLDVRYQIRNTRQKTQVVRLSQLIYNQNNELESMKFREIECSPGYSTHDIARVKVSDVHRWSTQHPYLYKVVTRLLTDDGEVIDQNIQRIGFKKLDFTASKSITLNGEPIKLIGTNRHQDYPGLGNALPKSRHIDDMLMISDIGFNFLRVSHYPQDPVMLTLADELGILTTVEIPFVNRANISDEFKENTKSMLEEMIERDFNHTSVVAWGTSNELSLRYGELSRSMSTDSFATYVNFVRELTKELNFTISSLDSTRMSFIALCCGYKLNDSLGLHEADLIGYNKYLGWYEGTYEDLDDYILGVGSIISDKPFMLSEYGAGADPRLHTLTPQRFDFSIEYQTAFHRSHLSEILENPLINWSAVWNFADFLAEHRGDAVPHVNSKGIVDLYRRPKDVYYYYRAALADKPYIAIGNQTWTRRMGQVNKNGIFRQPIQVYTNADSAQIMYNGKSTPCRKVENFMASWNIALNDGDNVLQARSCDSDNMTSDTFILHATLLPSDLSHGQWHDLRINIGSHCYYINDKIWMPDGAFQPGSYGYIGGSTYYRDDAHLIGTDRNILDTTDDPLYQTQHQSMDQYRISVPKGRYRIIMHYALLDENQILEEGDSTSTADLGRYSCVVNGERIVEANRDVTMFYPYQLSHELLVTSDDPMITIEWFEEDTPFLNGLEIIKLDK